MGGAVKNCVSAGKPLEGITPLHDVVAQGGSQEIHPGKHAPGVLPWFGLGGGHAAFLSARDDRAMSISRLRNGSGVARASRFAMTGSSLSKLPI